MYKYFSRGRYVYIALNVFSNLLNIHYAQMINETVHISALSIFCTLKILEYTTATQQLLTSI